MSTANAYKIDLADTRMHAIRIPQPPVGHANVLGYYLGLGVVVALIRASREND